MIKKLRFKFILLSMSAFLLVLTIIIAGINIVNYKGVIRDADELLTLLSENQGDFPREPENREPKLPPNMSPEIPYESRYFSVILNKDSGNIVQTDTSRITSVDSSAAITYAQTVMEKEKEHGFIDQFRYVIYAENEAVHITFLDCGRKFDSFFSFLFASIAISLAGYLVVFALIAFFSGRILRPISESYEKQTRFITDAGHELKTPLTIINADVDVLFMEIGESEWLTDIQKQTNRMSMLTRSLAYLARLEEMRDRSVLKIEFPISDIVSETAASFQILAQTQKKEFHCDIQPLLSYCGNEQEIGQLVSILLDNAIKYSPEGGQITLTLEKQTRSLRLSVVNTTITAIPKEKLPLLFDRFYRVDDSRNSSIGGSGIGLSIAKAITTSHGGRIQAQSEGGNLLRINVTLPV